MNRHYSRFVYNVGHLDSFHCGQAESGKELGPSQIDRHLYSQYDSRTAIRVRLAPSSLPANSP